MVRLNWQVHQCNWIDKLTTNINSFVVEEINRRNFSKILHRYSDVGDPYEKPINIELDEIIVYQEGRRVTLESDEHTQLLREARLSGKLL